MTNISISDESAKKSNASSLKIFENASFGEIRVAGTSENPLFCLADVCKVLDLGNPSQVKTRLDDGVISNEVIPDSLGRQQEATFVNEDGLYDVILDSRKPQAKAFRKWITSEVLPSIRKSGSYSVTNAQPTLQDKVFAINWVSDFLRLNDASKLKLAQAVFEPLGLPLPDYVPSKGILKSATELLKQNGMTISAQAFNLQAIEKGYLETKTRNGSKGKKKPFKCITEKGKAYGENQVCPNNPNQTQPLWYEDKFEELVEELGFRV